MKAMRCLFSLSVLITCLAIGTVALAMPEEAVCTAAEAIGCAQDEACIRGSAEKLSLPTLWKLNFKDNTYRSVMENGEEKTGVIIQIKKVGEALYLLGDSMTDDRVWSAYIDMTDWKMTLTGANYDAGYIVHGFCNSQILK